MLSKKQPIITRKLLISIVLITNALVWYYLAISFLKNIMGALTLDQTTSILIWSAHFGGIGFSAIGGALLLKKVKNRTNFLIAWLILGAISSALPLGLNLTGSYIVLVLALFLGVSLGLGMPCCMGYFTENIGTEIRGRVGGFTLFLTGICMVAFGIIGGDITTQILVLTVWKIFGLLFLLFFRETKEIPQKTTPIKTSYRSLIGQRSFLLYFLPWIMFSLITYLTAPVQDNIVGSSFIGFMIIVENAFIAIFSVIGGFLLDRAGRKRMSILGFVLLGLAYAVLGLGGLSLASWYFYMIVDGIAWGILFVIFVLTIWGDISYSSPSDMNYAIGVIPFFISKFLQFTVGNQIAADVPALSIFSLTAFFLFLAVLPLIYAPETLPEKVMKDRDLKSYVENAKKKVQKETERAKKKENLVSE